MFRIKLVGGHAEHVVPVKDVDKFGWTPHQPTYRVMGDISLGLSIIRENKTLNASAIIGDDENYPH